jgi:hypothetical protein
MKKYFALLLCLIILLTQHALALADTSYIEKVKDLSQREKVTIEPLVYFPVKSANEFISQYSYMLAKRGLDSPNMSFWEYDVEELRYIAKALGYTYMQSIDGNSICYDESMNLICYSIPLYSSTSTSEQIADKLIQLTYTIQCLEVVDIKITNIHAKMQSQTLQSQFVPFASAIFNAISDGTYTQIAFVTPSFTYVIESYPTIDKENNPTSVIQYDLFVF